MQSHYSGLVFSCQKVIWQSAEAISKPLKSVVNVSRENTLDSGAHGVGTPVVAQRPLTGPASQDGACAGRDGQVVLTTIRLVINP